MENITFSICDYVLMYTVRMVIPALLQKQILKDFHIIHSGMSRMKSLMRSFVFWPGIELLVKNCRGCALAEKSPPIKFESWPKTDVAWKRLHIDLAGPLNGSYYFIILDSFSKWPETSTVSVNFLNEITLKVRISWNDCLQTQFISSEFAKFCKFNSTEHITTPAFHPKSKGKVKRFVDSFKRGLKKINGELNEVVSLQFLRI